MATTNNERMDRVEATLDRVAIQQEINTAGIAENKAAIAENRTGITRLERAITTLVQAVSLHQQEFEASSQRFETIATEICGLQLENRQMLEELRNRREGEA